MKISALFVFLSIYIIPAFAQTDYNNTNYWVNQKYNDCLESGQSICSCQEQNNFLIIQINNHLKKIVVKPSIHYSWETFEFDIEKTEAGIFIIPSNDWIMGESNIKITKNLLTLTTPKDTMIFKPIETQKRHSTNMSDQLNIINTSSLFKYFIKLCSDTTSFPLSIEFIKDNLAKGLISVHCSDDYHYNQMYISQLDVDFFLEYGHHGIRVYKLPQTRARREKVDVSQLRDCQLFYTPK